MFDVRIQIEGFEEMNRLLRQLGPRTRQRVLAAGAAAGARVLAKAAKAAAPVGGAPSPASGRYGALRDNIRVRRIKKRDVASASYRADTGDAFWGHFLEYGTGRFNIAPGAKAKGSEARTHIPPRRWMTRAMEPQRASAEKAMTARIASGIKREAERLAKGTARRAARVLR